MNRPITATIRLNILSSQQLEVKLVFCTQSHMNMNIHLTPVENERIESYFCSHDFAQRGKDYLWSYTEIENHHELGKIMMNIKHQTPIAA